MAAKQNFEPNAGEPFPAGEVTKMLMKDVDPAYKEKFYEKLCTMSFKEIKIAAAATLEKQSVLFVELMDEIMKERENFENEKHAREMAEQEVRKLRRKINQLKNTVATELRNSVAEKKQLLVLAEKSKKEAVAQAVEAYKASQTNDLLAEAGELRNTVTALTLEKKELLVLAEKSKAEAGAQAVEAYKASQANELQDGAAELRNTVAALTLEMKELLVLAEKSKAEAGAQAVEAYKASQTNELRALAAELRNTVADLTLEKKELLVLAEKSKAEAGAQAVEAYKASQTDELRALAAVLRNTVADLTLEKKELLMLSEKSKAEVGASQTGIQKDMCEFSIQVCKGFWDYCIKEVLKVYPDLDLSGIVNPVDGIAAHSLLLLGRD